VDHARRRALGGAPSVHRPGDRGSAARAGWRLGAGMDACSVRKFQTGSRVDLAEQESSRRNAGMALWQA
jgi:hypothetical protein